MKWFFLVAVICVCSLTTQTALAQVSPQDQKWLTQAHQTNLAEIASGKLAAQDGHATSIRTVGNTLATDHAALDAKLVPVAKQLGVKLPDAPNAQQQADMRVLQHKHGMDFDQSWAHMEADGHIVAIELTTFEINHGSAPQVKQLATAALPVLKKHYQLLTHAATEIHGGP